MIEDWEILANDLRLQVDNNGGFVGVTLLDADDGNLFILGEDEILSLYDKLGEIIKEHRLRV